MLSNNTFLKTRIQRLLDGLIFDEKKAWRARAEHAQNEEGFIYWRKFYAKYLEKSEGKLGTLFAIMI